MAGNGLVWNEALPDDDVVANEIDEYNRDLRIAVRLRLAREHVFPAADNTGTVNAAGHHNFITLQAQTAAPVMAGTTGGALWVKSSDLGIYLTNSTGNDILLVTGATLRVITTGTLGSLVICSSANPNSVIALVGSADGRVLHTHSNTAAPNWLPIDLAGTSTVLSGALAKANAPAKASLGIDSGTAAGTGTVSFNFTFSSAPIVVVTPTSIGSDYGRFSVSDITTTGFTINAYSNTTFNWIAIGTPA